MMTAEEEFEQDSASGKKENIILDAHLVEMISNTAFRAILSNGHRLVVYSVRDQEVGAGLQVKVGDRVRVCLSPFDMGRGQIVYVQGNGS